VAAFLTLIGAETLIWFQPQKLLHDNRVHEPLPSAADLAPGSTRQPPGSPPSG
jgi:hypothetical protein